MAKYQVGEVLGRGAYGVVYKRLDLESNQFVAIKKLASFDGDDGISITTIREISLLKELKHDNIVELLDVVNDDNDQCYIIFEYMDIDMKKYMRARPLESLNKRRIKSFMHQILSGVDHCHKHKVLHRDLKPENLLLDLNSYVVKIADFGLARDFHNLVGEYSPEVVTLWYRAPEIFLGSRQYSTPIDMWSVGCIFAELIMHQPLFDGHNEISHLRQIFSIMGTPDETTWPGVTLLPNYLPNDPKHDPVDLRDYFPDLKPAGLDLLSQMLCMNPARRISAHDALEHAYFKNDDDDDDEDDDDDDDFNVDDYLKDDDDEEDVP